jgi:hypothetical protein
MGYGAGAAGLAVAAVAAASGLIWLAFRGLARFRNLPGECLGAALTGLGVFWFVSRTLS